MVSIGLLARLVVPSTLFHETFFVGWIEPRPVDLERELRKHTSEPDGTW
jgi:hypothetical protein